MQKVTDQPKKSNGITQGSAVAAPRTTSRWIDVSPILAEKWLAKNNRNRLPRIGQVQFYANQMAAGKWRVNGEAIKFDSNGNLLDGQHRLMAVIQSGETVRVLTVFGLEPEVFSTLDQGAKRSLKDHFDLLGEKNTSVLASATRLMALYDRGDITVTGSAAKVSGEDGMATLDRHPGLRRSAGVMGGVTIMARSPLAFLHYLFSQRDEGLADQFVAWLRDGEGLTRSMPVYRLREWMIRNTRNRVQPSTLDTLRAVAHAWNKTRAGESCRSLRFPVTGFPDIK